jgi:hypothetical protein
MNGFALALALTCLGVGHSIQQAEDGKVEYVILVEPESLKTLAAGEHVSSDVAASEGPFDRLILRVGTAAPRRTATHLAEYKRLLVSGGRYATSDLARPTPGSLDTIVWPAKTKPELNYNVTYGWQPDEVGKLVYYMQLDPILLQSLAAGDEIHAPIDPAAGRIDRFIVLAGKHELPKIPVTPPAAAGNLAGANAGIAAEPMYGAGGTAPPLVSTPDYSGAAATGSQFGARGGNRYTSSLGDQTTGLGPPQTIAPQIPAPNAYAQQAGQQPIGPAYDPRYDPQRTPAGQPIQYGQQQPAPQYQDPRFQDPRYQGYVSQTGAAETQSPPRTNYGQTIALPNPPTLDDRVASVSRNTTNAAAPLPAPQVSSNTSAKSEVEAKKEEKPWMPLMLTAFLLFFSLGGNLYLGWTAAEFHSRYRMATERLRSASR